MIQEYFELDSGNRLSLFYNNETHLLVVDLLGEDGGNEIVRMTLDEDVLLAHLKPKKSRKKSVRPQGMH